MMIAAELSHQSEELENFKKEAALKGNMPDGIFGGKLLAEMENNKAQILAQMGDTLIDEIKGSWSYKAKIQDIQIDRGNSGKWTLSGTLDWSDSNDLDKITKMISVSSSDKAPSINKFLPSYVKALAVIAQRSNRTNDAQSIKIFIYNGDNSKEATSMAVSMTPLQANKILQEIYTAAFGDETQRPYSKAVPASMLDAQGIVNIRAYKDKLLNESWKYFDKKTLFDPITDVGFEANDFANQWKEATQKMRALMQFTIDENTSSNTIRKRA